MLKTPILPKIVPIKSCCHWLNVRVFFLLQVVYCLHWVSQICWLDFTIVKLILPITYLSLVWTSVDWQTLPFSELTIIQRWRSINVYDDARLTVQLYDWNRPFVENYRYASGRKKKGALNVVLFSLNWCISPREPFSFE